MTTGARPAALLALVLAASPAGAATPVRQYTIEQFMATTTLTGAAFSADETGVLVSSNHTGVFNAYRIPIAGGPPVPLTASTKHTTQAVAFFPADDRFLYTRDESGNEKNHLYVLDPKGRVKDLTPGVSLKATFQRFSGDGKAIFVTTNERDARYFDLYRYDATTYDRALVYEDKTGYQLGAVSDDGRWLALRKPRTTSVSDLYLWDSATRETKRLSPEAASGDFQPQDFDPGGRVPLLPHQRGQRVPAGAPLRDGQRAGTRRWRRRSGTSRTRRSPGGGRTASRDQPGRAHGHPHRGRAVGSAPWPCPPSPKGTSRPSGSPTARSGWPSTSTATAPQQPLRLELRRQGGPPPHRLAEQGDRRRAPGGVGGRALPVLRRDGRSRTCCGSRTGPRRPPRPPRSSGSTAGPGGQTRKGYSPLIQYLVNHGYVVLGINNRGQLAATARRSTPRTTAGTAGSRSGTAWRRRSTWPRCPTWTRTASASSGAATAATWSWPRWPSSRTSSRPGVDIFGVSNWVRTLKSMPSWWEAQRLALFQELGDPREGRGEAARGLAGVPRGQDPAAPDRAAGGQRPAGHPAGVRRHRGRGEEERRAGGVRGVPRRGARLHQARNQITATGRS